MTTGIGRTASVKTTIPQLSKLGPVSPGLSDYPPRLRRQVFIWLIIFDLNHQDILNLTQVENTVFPLSAFKVVQQ